MHLIIIGAPGSGKGTQSKLIVDKFDYFQFSTGDALREAVAKKTEYGLQASSYIAKGALVPDDVIFSIVEDKLGELKDVKGVIYDGFPRNIEQAKKLDRILGAKNQQVDVVLYLKIDDGLLLERISGRRISEKTGKEYHNKNNPPKIPGKCDVDGSNLIQRIDDTEEKVKIRINVFKDATFPLLKYYSGKVFELDAAEDIKEVNGKINHILQKK